MGGSKDGEVVGYKYFLGADMKWSHSPIDSFNKLYIDDKLAWQGTRRTGDIFVDEPLLFGEFEGGIQGTLSLADGDPEQLQNPYLLGQLGPGVPAFRGVTSTISNQMYLGNNPYLKGWKGEFTRIRRRLLNGAAIPQWNEFYAPVPPFTDNEEGYNTLTRFFGATVEPQQILIQIDLSSHTNGFKNNNMDILGQGQNIDLVKQTIVGFLNFLENDAVWENGTIDLGIAFFRGSTGAPVFGEISSGSQPNPASITEGNLFNAPRRGLYYVEGLTRGAGIGEIVELLFANLAVSDLARLTRYTNVLNVYPDTAPLDPMAIAENALDFFNAISKGDKPRVNYIFSSFDFPKVSESVIDGPEVQAVEILNGLLAEGAGSTNGKVAFVPDGVNLPELVQGEPDKSWFGYIDPDQIRPPPGWVNVPQCETGIRSSTWGVDWFTGTSAPPADQIGGACQSPAGWGGLVNGGPLGTTIPTNAVLVMIGTQSLGGLYQGSYYPHRVYLKGQDAPPWKFQYESPNGEIADFPEYTLSPDGPTSLANFLSMLSYQSIPLSTALDMNPAHIIREALTDQQWGLGIPEEEIDETSFFEASVTLWNERFGVSLVWNKQTEIEEFIKLILNHIDAVLYVRRDTGRWTLKLIRYDYDPNTIPVFDDDDVVSWDQVTRKTEAELANSVTVKYNSRLLRNPASLTVNNLAQIQQLGAVIPATVNYPGIWQPSLAAVVADRDLRSLSTATISGSITVTRRGATLYPGDVFRLSSARYGLSGEIMRVVEVGIGDGRDNAVYIKFVQDVFNLGTIPITSGGGTEWQDVKNFPQPVAERVVEEESYRSFVRRNGELVASEILADEPNAGYILAYGKAPTPDSLNARIQYDDNADGVFENTGLASLCATAIVANSVLRTPLDNSWQLLEPIGLSGVRVGSLAYIGGEYVRIDEINRATNTIVVGRGCADTPPIEHIEGSRIFFFDQFASAAVVQFVDSDVVDIRLLTNTGLGQLRPEFAPVDTLEFDARINRPYPVGNLRINASYDSQIYTGTLAITWAHRDRAQDTGAVPEPHTAGNIGPEVGVSYTVRLLEYDLDNVLIGELYSTNVGTATSLSVDTSLYPMTVSLGYVKVVVETDRGGLLNRASPYIYCFPIINPTDFPAWAWYDANVLSSMSMDDVGIEPVEYDEDPVGLIVNQRGTVE